jgi:hypothetical protein
LESLDGKKPTLKNWVGGESMDYGHEDEKTSSESWRALMANY